MSGRGSDGPLEFCLERSSDNLELSSCSVINPWHRLRSLLSRLSFPKEFTVNILIRVLLASRETEETILLREPFST